MIWNVTDAIHMPSKAFASRMDEIHGTRHSYQLSIPVNNFETIGLALYAGKRSGGTGAKEFFYRNEN